MGAHKDKAEARKEARVGPICAPVFALAREGTHETLGVVWLLLLLLLLLFDV